MPSRRLAFLLVYAALLTAAGNAADKSVYSLANPTPSELLRELTTDRPDFTESPFTVDAGHSQLEMDFANLSTNHLDGIHTRTLSVGSFNVRLGIRSNVEAGVFISPYTRQRETARDETTEAHSGLGDVTLRTKLNFSGNDGGNSAYGLIVDVKLPTAPHTLGNGVVEGRIILPANFKLAAGWELAAMTEIDFIKSEDDRGRDLVWADSVSFGHSLTEKLGGYLELTSAVGPGTPSSTFDVGLTWSVEDNTQLDAGVNVGLTRAADDLVFFAGLSRRF